MTRRLAALPLIAFVLLLALPVQADPVEKIFICHAAGLEGTTQYVTLHLPPQAVFGQAGHFNENGTSQAGHEQDYLGECDEETPTSTTTEPTTTTEAVTTTTEATTTTEQATTTTTVQATTTTPARLPFTGIDTGTLAAAAAGLILTGLALTRKTATG